MASRADLLRAVLLVLLASDHNGSPEGRGVRRRLGGLAGSVSNRMLDEIDVDGLVSRVDVDGLVQRVDVEGLVSRVDVDQVLDRVDVDRLLARVDVDGLLARVDLDALLARVDVDGLLDQVDVDRLLARVEVEALLARVDVNGLLDRVEVDALLARVDVDRLLDRADVNRLLDRVLIDALLDRVTVDALLDRADVNRLLDRVDVDALMARVDVELLLERVDVDALVRRAGIPELVAQSTGQVAGSALDLARRQLVGIDVGVNRILLRLLRRDPAHLPPGPPALIDEHHRELHAPDVEHSRARARLEVSGYYAGPVSRLLAFFGDVAMTTSSFTFLAVLSSLVVGNVLGIELDVEARTGPLWALALTSWYFIYWFGSTAIAGRTPAMLIAGLTVVRRDGTPVRPRQALLRTITLPITLALFVLGVILVVIDPERRTLHDRLSGTAVVFDWGGRPAELPTPISRWIAEHGG